MLYQVRDYHEIIFVNISRANLELDYLYPILESIKDGKFLSTKYEPRLVRMNKTPHVVVLANVKPN